MIAHGVAALVLRCMSVAQTPSPTSRAIAPSQSHDNSLAFGSDSRRDVNALPESTRGDSSTAWAAPAPIRLSIGLIYFFFGFLKFFPDLSPAELIASQTVMKMTCFALDGNTALQLLAVMECTIGLCFLFNLGLRWLSFLYLFHQISTFMPLVVYPELTFKIAPFAPTLEGQYILKNLTFVAIGWIVILPEVNRCWRHRSVRVVKP